jgi:hypothetical protein
MADLSPLEQRRLLAERDDLLPAVAAELAALTSMQIYLLEIEEPTAAAKVAAAWSRRFLNEMRLSAATNEEPESKPTSEIETRPRRAPPAALRSSDTDEVVISTPDNAAIAQAVRDFLRIRLRDR